ncbi:MAG: DJ-1/PfpI family protein, partial [Candidatus Bipolaricaulia bacterium]
AEELDFVGVYEVLAKLKQLEKGDLEVELIGTEAEVTCALGMRAVPHETYHGLADYDLLVIPGGRGVQALTHDGELLREIREFSQDHMICSVCTGALVLGAAGVLEGRRAATHHLYKEELQEYCEVVEDRVVQDGNVITAAGVSAALDLGLKIVALARGREVAERVAERIEYWRNPLPIIGAALVRDEEILLVRQTYGRLAGRFTLPSGFVGHGETIHTAVKRELAEEVGVEGEVRGLIVVSSSAAGNFIWLLTLLDWVSGKPAPDMVEVDAARFFSLEEVKQSEEISDFLKRIIERILTDRLPTLPFDAALVAEFDREPDQFAIYLGH